MGDGRRDFMCKSVLAEISTFGAHDSSKCRTGSRRLSPKRPPSTKGQDCCGDWDLAWCEDGYLKIHGDGGKDGCQGYRQQEFNCIPPLGKKKSSKRPAKTP